MELLNYGNGFGSEASRCYLPFKDDWSSSEYYTENIETVNLALPKYIKIEGKSSFTNVTKIDSCAFWNCQTLETVIIPDTIEEFGDRVFYYCSSLLSIDIPSSVKIAETSSFDGIQIIRIYGDIPSAVYSVTDESHYAFGAGEGAQVYLLSESATRKFFTTFNEICWIGCEIYIPKALRNLISESELGTGNNFHSFTLEGESFSLKEETSDYYIYSSDLN